MSSEMAKIADDLDSFVHDMREDGNDATALWLEKRASALTNQPLAVDSNASAEARLREAYSALCEPRESQASDNLEGALYDIKRLRDDGRPVDDVCIRTIERVLNQLVRAERSLSAHPHTSDCARDGETDCGATRCRDLGCFGACKPSDRTADVTRELCDAAFAALRESYSMLAFAFNRLHGSARSRDGELCESFGKVRGRIEKIFKDAGEKL